MNIKEPTSSGSSVNLSVCFICSAVFALAPAHTMARAVVRDIGDMKTFLPSPASLHTYKTHKFLSLAVGLNKEIIPKVSKNISVCIRVYLSFT